MHGPEAEAVHRASLHSQAHPLGRWWARGLGEAPEWVDLMVLRVATVSPRAWRRLHREPQCPGAHLAPFTGPVPAHTGAGPSPWGGGGKTPFIHSAANSAKVGSAHVGLVTQGKRDGCREMKEDRCQSLLFMNNDLSFIHSITPNFHLMTVMAATFGTL